MIVGNKRQVTYAFKRSNSHTMNCTDWELGESWRNRAPQASRRSGDQRHLSRQSELRMSMLACLFFMRRG